MAGGKDIKFGHDKRPISTFTNREQNLYNYQTGEVLVDESGNPLITEQEEFFLNDATSERSTSVAFGSKPSDVYDYTKHSFVGLEQATYGVDLDSYVGSATSLPVFQRDGNVVGAGTTVVQRTSYKVPITGHPGISTFDGNVEVKTVYASGSRGEKNKIYYGDGVGIQTVVGVKLGDKITGSNIPDGTFVTKVDRGRLIVSNDINTGIQTSRLRIRRSEKAPYKVNNIIKIAEVFRETSEVSTTLLGVNRAETQLSLFSNVSSYGLDTSEFEGYSVTTGRSLSEWDQRYNQTYGKHYNAKVDEDTMESAITLESYPVPYAFPFNLTWDKIGFYDSVKFPQYKNFILFGNALYNYYTIGNGASEGWGLNWANKFLDPSIVNIVSDDVKYNMGFPDSFAAIDTWTDTWRDIKDKQFKDPNGNLFDDSAIELLIGEVFKTSNTIPGYSTTNRRFSALQSRRVFRYQPGRISGFTFGVKTSDEPVSGYRIEWGIANPTDQYMFVVYGGQLSIRRRSTIYLDEDSIARSNLDPKNTSVNIDGVFYPTIQPLIPDSDPYGDGTEFFTLDIPREKWNGDRLDGNGVSGYQIQMDRVTMWKIEFGWYGAIGARFYAYVPVNNGDARWVVVHTLVIENSVGQPCLQDSYFRLKYITDVFNTTDMRKPCFLYKYGASYYIDGGDEGTQNVYAINSGIKSTYTGVQKPIIAITPKTFMTSQVGTEIVNKKMIIPKSINITSDSLTKVQIVNVSGAPGFGHAFTPGVASTITGRDIYANFTDGNTITAINMGANDPGTPGGIDTYFYDSDVGAKLIGPGVYNYYIESVSGDAGAGSPTRNGQAAKTTATVVGYGPGTKNYPRKHSPTYSKRLLAGMSVIDSVTGLTTSLPNGGGDPAAGIGTFGYPIRLSNYETEFASDFKFTGSKIEVQFLNPESRDRWNGTGGSNWYSDFVIGLTNKTPIVSSPDILTEWEGVNWIDIETGNAGSGNTSIIPKDNILYGEHSHDFAGMNADGDESSESFDGSVIRSSRLEIDSRIPTPKGAGSGRPSLITYTVRDPITVTNITQVHTRPNSTVPGTYLVMKAGLSFPTEIDEFDGGQVAVSLVGGSVNITSATFEGDKEDYTDGDGNKVEFIKISASLGATYDGVEFNLYVRPIKMVSGDMPTKQKLYNYEPWPLYLVGKLKDNAAINGITVKETVGDFSRTITPRLYVKGNIEVTNADNEAGTLGQAPPHYREVDRLSSALYDTQDEQTLRPGVVKDTFYIGANETETVDLSKIFNPDRDSIVPDNLNVEATFFAAEKIDAGSVGQVQATVNYTEQ